MFAAALIWIIALATYVPTDPVWFFSTGLHVAPANFAGRVGAFLAELSFQLVGYAAYAIPAVLVIVGWNYFWCRDVDAAATKATGTFLFFSCISAFLSLVFGTLDLAGKPFRAGGSAGEFLAGELSEYLNRTGSLIIVVTMIFLSIIISTHFSFGRLFAAITRALTALSTQGFVAFREWRDDRRREKQRREVIAKHTKKGVPPPEIKTAVVAPPPQNSLADAAGEMPPSASKPAARKKDAEPPPIPQPAFGSAKSFQPAKPPKVSMPAPPLPFAAPEPMIGKAPAERRKGEYALPPLALLDAPKTERKIDERELMDGARLLEEKCREFAVEGSVVQIHP